MFNVWSVGENNSNFGEVVYVDLQQRTCFRVSDWSRKKKILKESNFELPVLRV